MHAVDRSLRCISPECSYAAAIAGYCHENCLWYHKPKLHFCLLFQENRKHTSLQSDIIVHCSNASSFLLFTIMSVVFCMCLLL